MYTSTELAATLERANGWLKRTFLHSEGVAGWGHSPEEQIPSEWGGTLDGIRGLLATGELPLSPVISESVDWLKKRQRADGGFGARELRYSSAEATAWVVITLARLGLRTDNDSVVRDAVRYLEQCLDASGGAATTPRDVQRPRALPTALTLWALARQPGEEQVCSKIVTRLHRMQDPETGGWGVQFGAAPNAATTAQVLHSLAQADISAETSWVAAGVDYLLTCQENDGSWRNSHDEWFTQEMPRIPVRCAHFGTGWAVLSLSGYGTSKATAAARKGVHYLIRAQRPSGAWLFENFDPTEFVWCTSQVACALAEWRNSAPSSQVDEATTEVRSAASVQAAQAFGWLRSSFVYIAIAALTVGELHNVIRTAVMHIISSVRLSAGAIWINILSSAVWAILTVLGGLAIKQISHSRKPPGE